MSFAQRSNSISSTSLLLHGFVGLQNVFFNLKYFAGDLSKYVDRPLFQCDGNQKSICFMLSKNILFLNLPSYQLPNRLRFLLNSAARATTDTPRFYYDLWNSLPLDIRQLKMLTLASFHASYFCLFQILGYFFTHSLLYLSFILVSKHFFFTSLTLLNLFLLVATLITAIG